MKHFAQSSFSPFSQARCFRCQRQPLAQLQIFPHSKNQHGFTLVELIVVILLLGIISINVGSRFFGNTTFSDRKVADELVEAIRYAQHLAMSRAGSDTFKIVTTSTSYSVQDSSNTAVNNPNRSGLYTVTIPTNTSLSVASVSFNGLGQPTPDTDTSITVGSTFTITIERETGYARY